MRHVDPANPRSATRIVGNGVTGEPGTPARELRRGGAGALRTVGDVLATLGEETELRGEPIEGGAQLIQRGDEAFLFGREALRDLRRSIAQGEAQLSRGGAEALHRGRELGDFACPRARGDLRVARELRELPGRELLAEEERCRIGKLMRFVEDERIARGEQLREPFVPQHHVGEEQMMVDDDDVRFQCRLARLQHKAVGVERALGAEAVVACRRDEGPDRSVLRDVAQRAAVAGVGRASEGDDLRQVPRILARG